jgi:hypothetical protein
MVDRTMSFMLLDPKQLAGYYKRLIGAWRIFRYFLLFGLEQGQQWLRP